MCLAFLTTSLSSSRLFPRHLPRPGVRPAPPSSLREAADSRRAEGRQVLRAAQAQQHGRQEEPGRAEAARGRDRAAGLLPGEGERRAAGAGGRAQGGGPVPQADARAQQEARGLVQAVRGIEQPMS